MKINVLKKSVGVVVVALLGLGITGCGPSKIPVKKEMGRTSYEMPKIQQYSSTGKSIALVATDFGRFDGRQERGTAYSPYKQFENNYERGLERAMGQAFSEIITKKGFTTMGPFKTFDDITYQDKKTTYLAVIPKLTLEIDATPTNNAMQKKFYTETGTMSLNGELYLKVVEPLTQQALINKRIDLSDFDISKPYVYQVAIQNQGKSSGGGLIGALVGSAVDGIGDPEHLKDNTDKVMAEMLTEFYNKSVQKINTYLSREEMLSLEGEIDNLKNLKRY